MVQVIKKEGYRQRVAKTFRFHLQNLRARRGKDYVLYEMPYKLILGRQRRDEQEDISIRISLLAEGRFFPDVLKVDTFSMEDFRENISEFLLETYRESQQPPLK